MIILQEKKLDAGSEECLDGFMRGVDDGLPLHVETCIQYHLAASGLSYRNQKGVKIRVVALAHGLQASRAVDVGNSREQRARLGSYVDHADHVGMLLAGSYIKPA